MGKIKEFYVTTSSDNSKYLAGSVVEGNVIIDLIRPKVTTGPLKITLSGKAKIQWRQTPLRFITDEQAVLDDISVNLWGTGSETLAPGKHEFPYTFQLPNDLPSSFESHHGNIRYTLTATLPTRKSEVTREKIIKVYEIIDVDKPDLLDPSLGSESKSLCCLCCVTAPIELSAVTERSGYAYGDTIVIKEHHRYRRITDIKATLLRRTSYHFRDEHTTNVTNKQITSTSYFTDINSFNEPGSRIGHLVIPNGTLSINCDILKVSYFVSVTLTFKLSVAKSLNVLMPITVGNARRSPTGDIVPLATIRRTSTTGSMPHASNTGTMERTSATGTTQRTSTTGTMQSGAPITSHMPITSTMPCAPTIGTMPSPPQYTWSNTLERDTAPAVVPSAPMYPSTLPILTSPTETNVEIPSTPPPPYSDENTFL